jgi:hypothetical protein
LADLAFVLTIIAFFAVAAAFVTVCDRIIGADEEAFADAPELPDQERLAA